MSTITKRLSINPSPTKGGTTNEPILLINYRHSKIKYVLRSSMILSLIIFYVARQMWIVVIDTGNSQPNKNYYRNEVPAKNIARGV